MRHRILPVLAATFLVAAMSTAGAQAPKTPDPFRARIDAIAKEIHPAVIAMRRDIHMHPELGFRETRTAGIVADRLRATVRGPEHAFVEEPERAAGLMRVSGR